MIPKKIHYCWLSDDPFPDLIARCIASWRRVLPDYEFVLWDRKKFDIDRVIWVREAFAAGKYAFASDYIRLHALYEEGGIYLDADVELLGNFDGFLNEPSFIGYERSGDLEPAVIGAQKGCTWIAACLKHYDDRHFVGPNGTRDTTPLPLIVEATLYDLGLMPASAPKNANIAGAVISFYPADYFSPKHMHGEPIKTTLRTVAIHHFDGQWVERTVVYALKQRAHRMLHFLFGPNSHRRMVKMLRAIKR